MANITREDYLKFLKWLSEGRVRSTLAVLMALPVASLVLIVDGTAAKRVIRNLMEKREGET